jgi:glycosyltransferase involved in cell wall biosynthesis
MGIESPGVSDTVEDGKTGFLSPEDLPSFTAKLTRLCIDQALRRKMGDAAREHSTRYAIERTSHTLLEHYKRLVYASRPRRDSLGVRLRGLLEYYLQ